MTRIGILTGALAAACTPRTQGVGVIETTSDSSAGDGPSTSSASVSSADSGEDPTRFDMGVADAPGEDECTGQTFCQPDALAPFVLAGTTPLGEVELDYVYFGVGICRCARIEYGVQLVWSSQPLALQQPGDPPTDRLMTTIAAEAGPQVATAYLSRDGTLDDAEATVELESIPTDPLAPSSATRLTGTIAITAAGWSLQGQIDAPLCHSVDYELFCK
jgi:hypothetical protein